ncbi:Uracil-DNA glycosylase [Candidatus Providencia siddallii]|uniref:Uracil-DNA glycosylase n=1 Tax=Candidatus Providencia siddallii TaxID=1715285 RepID=A0A0M6W749_9GAMM|nr:Uracil-DNA glycosylase [Candidatus Providencia siddallii]
MFTDIIWRDVIENEKKKLYFKKILTYIFNERKKGKIIYPMQNDVFNAFVYTELKNIKVVILGQDPYYGFKQAHGFSFSVRPGIKIPPSLVNIYKELEKDIKDFQFPNHGYLFKWALQGVFLLNIILTVEHGIANSHSNIGWNIFTDKILKIINDNTYGVVFLLWGSYAKKKSEIIDSKKHFILKASHPSPLSAHCGFFGCKHFSQTNFILEKQGKTQINWNL